MSKALLAPRILKRVRQEEMPDVEAYHIEERVSLCHVVKGKKEVVGLTCSNSRHGTDNRSEHAAPRLTATVLGRMDGWKGGREGRMAERSNDDVHSGWLLLPPSSSSTIAELLRRASHCCWTERDRHRRGHITRNHTSLS